MTREESLMEYLDFSVQEEAVHPFDELYHRYHQALYSNILKIVRKAEAAEDILQEVFASLWVHHAGIEKARVANWLFVVSYNKSISYIKKSRNAPMQLPLEEGEVHALADEAEISEEEFELLLQRIEEAVTVLPGRKKKIFQMYRLEGKSLDDIAQLLQLSPHTVKDHLKLANKAIRAYLLEKYPLPNLAVLLLLLLP